MNKPYAIKNEVKEKFPEVLVNYLIHLHQTEGRNSNCHFKLRVSDIGGGNIQEIYHNWGNAEATHKVFGCCAVDGVVKIKELSDGIFCMETAGGVR